MTKVQLTIILLALFVGLLLLAPYPAISQINCPSGADCHGKTPTPEITLEPPMYYYLYFPQIYPIAPNSYLP